MNERIKDYLTRVFGEGNTKLYEDLIETPAFSYLRVNTLSSSMDELLNIFSSRYNIQTSPVKNIDIALRVEKDPESVVGRTFEHNNGYYYIQSLSSMLPPFVLNPLPGESVLDLCAAPGSKTTQIAAMMKNQGELIANEVQNDRLRTLIFNLERMDVLNCGVVHERGEWLGRMFNSYFDKILVDVPCSGLGILQKKSEVNLWWNEKNVEALTQLQYRLLVSAIKMLKPGGTLVYSTCTLTYEENEEIIDRAIAKYPVEIVDFDMGVETVEGYTDINGKKFSNHLAKTKRILPWEAKSEGFYIAKMIKTGETESLREEFKKATNIASVSKKEMKTYIKIINDAYGTNNDYWDDFNFFKIGDQFFISSSELNPTSPASYERIGTKFGNSEKNSRFTLNPLFARVIGKEISKNIAELNSEQAMNNYMSGSLCGSDEFELVEFTGIKDVAVKFAGKIIGTGVLTGESLKSRFPKTHRQRSFVYSSKRHIE